MNGIPYVNDVRYEGQEARIGLTVALEGTVEKGDAVQPGTLAGSVTRGTGAIVGFLASKEADGMGAVNSHRVVQVKCAAGLALGRQLLVGDGSGGVAVGAAGAPAWVLNVYAVGTQNYASVFLI